MCKYPLEILLSVLLDKNLEVELLDHTAILFLIFKGNSILFFIVVALFYMHVNSAQGFQFLHNVTNAYFHFLNSSRLNEYEVIAHCGFDLGFPGGSEIKVSACNALLQ